MPKKTQTTRTRGRKSKLTEDFIKKFCKLLKDGATITAACAAMDITPKSYYRWIKSNRTKLEKKLKIEAEKAINLHKIELLNMIKKHSLKHWQAAAWILERRFRNEFGKDVIEVDESENVDEEFL